MSSKKVKLFRSKSMCSLSCESISNDSNRPFIRYRSRTTSDSSIEVYVINETDSDDTSKCKLEDSGVGDKSYEEEVLSVLEQKIDGLSEMFQEQCRLLTGLKEEIRNSKTVMEKVDFSQVGALSDIIKKIIDQSSLNDVSSSSDGINPRAKILLDAIESSAVDKDKEIQNMIANFLQSDEVKNAMVQATAESVRGVVGGCLSRDVSALYLPVIEHSHRTLLAHLTATVEEAFLELEDSTATLSKSVYKISKSLRRVIERHQFMMEAAANPQKNLLTTLKCTVEELLRKELQQWREKVIVMFSPQPQLETEMESPDSSNPPPEPQSPITPPVLIAPPGRSLIDQIMTVAELKKQIEDGDVNDAFSRALCAGDLSLVMAACRAAAHSPFTPHCRLQQSVLLALLQQLSTDMLHDTQLKCRYLEDAMISLDLSDPSTRTHLPLVVGEMRKHLSKFLVSFPTHVANRRISLIIMAADNLLK